MDEQELVRIDLQLPVSALDSLAYLAQQLRLLTDAAGSRPDHPAQPAQERGENTFFDAARFQRMQPEAQAAPPMEQDGISITDVKPAAPVRLPEMKEVRSPESAGRAAVEYREGSALADPPGSGPIPDAAAASDGLQIGRPVKAAGKGTAEERGEIPAVRPEMERDVPPPPEGRPEPEGRIPDAGAEKAGSFPWDAEAHPVRAGVQPGAEAPLGAGIVVTAEPEAPQDRWTGVTEELVKPGPAPLTAESVSLAFQRDGRRYDNGFPLY